MGRLLTAMLLLVSSITLAQTTFRSQTELVLVPTVVTDSNGYPITGLKKEDFSVLQDGRAQNIAIFEAVSTAPSVTRRASTVDGEFTNGFVAAEHPQRLSIIVIDTMHSAFVDQAYARQQLLKYLASVVNQHQPIALVVLSLKRFQVIHDFITDPKVLVEALSKVRTHAPEIHTSEGADTLRTVTSDSLADQEAQWLAGFSTQPVEQISELQRIFVETKTDEYMQQMASAFSGVPGRKSIVWIASSPPSPSLRTLNLLADSQMAIYPVDARGLTTPEYGVPVTPAQPGQRQPEINSAVAINQNIILGFRLLAEQTGGRAFFNRNDLDNSFHEATSDSSAYYLLGFYRRADDRQVGWRKLSVKVNRKGTQVRARSGYLVPGGREYTYTEKSSVELALESPWNFTGLPFTARLLPTKPSATAGKTTAGFVFRLPGGLSLVDEADDNHLRLEFTAVALNGKGEQVAEASERIDKHLTPEEMSSLRSSGTAFESHVDIAPGDYTVKFVVRDAITGRIGSVTAPLTVETIH